MSNPDTLATLGKSHEKDLGRDAVHVAVISCAMDPKLKRGTHVVIDHGLIARRPKVDESPVGIVDPFLTEGYEGSRVWVYLYPNTITGLKHEWSHPTLDVLHSQDPSKKWVEGFARDMGQSYSRLMKAADTYFVKGDYTHDNTESYKGMGSDQWNIFWRHYAIIRGTQLPKPTYDDTPFSCAC